LNRPVKDTQVRTGGMRRYLEVFQYTGRALALVWRTSRGLSATLAVLSMAAGLLPASIAYVGKLIVDDVVHALASGAAADQQRALWYVVGDLALVLTLAAVQKGIQVSRSLLRALLGQRVNVMILEKALTLELRHFEDPEFYDRMSRARREASSRPLSLVMRTFGLVQDGISLASYGLLLLSFSGWAALGLVMAALPALLVETRFSDEAFRLFRWQTPETREQTYLEILCAREDYAKEVQLFQLGPRFLERYRAIFDRLYRDDRNLTLRRGLWGFALGCVSTAAFYGVYAWIAVAAMRGQITLGEMTMYVLVFKQGQAALSSLLVAVGGMYEDNLYLSNLYEFLEVEVPAPLGTATSGPVPGDGIRFEKVSFRYPGAEQPALRGVSLHLPPGRKLAVVGENGSGKTTLIKLLARLYEPSEGRVTLDGRDLREWDVAVLRRRLGVIFQDFVRYQFSVGENIGAGDDTAWQDELRWQRAAERGLAAPFIDTLPQRYRTQLGRWFRDGRELSLGQWQKLALARAFMRESADLLVLDEPTAAMDAEAEVRIFERFREMTANQMAVLISHRFSTVRMADYILVLRDGQIAEEGTHDELLARDGTYAHLFRLQAAGYQ
jgi:ABC-type multidrug transport system fused ATPase/permease subunit